MEPDRERAIDEILRESELGDTVLIAGKGHETYQEIADTIFPFDDRETVRAVLAAIEEARARGLELIDEAPRPGSHGTTIAFLHPRATGGVLCDRCPLIAASRPLASVALRLILYR